MIPGLPRRLLPTAFALVMAALPGTAQVPGERAGSQILFLSVQARGLALADAAAALGNDLGGTAMNPALAASLEGTVVELSGVSLSRALSAQEIGFGARAGDGWGIALKMATLHAGHLAFFSDPGLRSAGFELRTGLAAGVRVARGLSAGLLLDVLHATTDADPLWGVTAGAGLAYTPDRLYRFGLSLRGPGRDYDLRLPVLPQDELSTVVPRVLTLSAAGDVPLGASHALLLLYQSDKIMGRRDVIFRMGAEYRPPLPVGIRTGLAVRGSAVEPRAGMGLALGPLRADYAYAYSRRDGVRHAVTLGFHSP